MNRLEQIRRVVFAKEAKETLWSLATKGTAALLFVGLNVFLARVLGVERWGSWSFLYANLTIVFLLSYFGLNNAARAYVARDSGTPALRDTLRASLVLRVLFSAAFTGLFWWLAGPLAGWLRRPDLAGLFRLAAPLIFLMGFNEYLKQVFTGLHRLVFHFIVNLVEFGGKILLAVLLLSAVVSLENVVLAFWLAVGASVVVGFVFWARYYRDSGKSGDGRPVLSPAPSPASSEVEGEVEGGAKELKKKSKAGEEMGEGMRGLLAYSLPLFLISIGFLVLTEIDTLMLGLLSTDTEVGLFAIGKQLANRLPQFALALSMGMMPGFARLNADNLAEMRNKFAYILRLNALVFLPAGLLLVLLAPWFVPLLFGEEFAASVLPLQILTAWIVMTSFNIFFNALLDYRGLARRRAVNFLLTLGATIGLNLVLIPQYGALGAAISTSVAYAPYLILNALEARKVFRKT